MYLRLENWITQKLDWKRILCEKKYNSRTFLMYMVSIFIPQSVSIETEGNQNRLRRNQFYSEFSLLLF